MKPIIIFGILALILLSGCITIKQKEAMSSFCDNKGMELTDWKLDNFEDGFLALPVYFIECDNNSRYKTYCKTTKDNLCSEHDKWGRCINEDSFSYRFCWETIK